MYIMPVRLYVRTTHGSLAHSWNGDSIFVDEVSKHSSHCSMNSATQLLSFERVTAVAGRRRRRLYKCISSFGCMPPRILLDIDKALPLQYTGSASAPRTMVATLQNCYFTGTLCYTVTLV
jgi:hypothetical protein